MSELEFGEFAEKYVMLGRQEPKRRGRPVKPKDPNKVARPVGRPKKIIDPSTIIEKRPVGRPRKPIDPNAVIITRPVGRPKKDTSILFRLSEAEVKQVLHIGEIKTDEAISTVIGSRQEEDFNVSTEEPGGTDGLPNSPISYESEDESEYAAE